MLVKKSYYVRDYEKNGNWKDKINLEHELFRLLFSIKEMQQFEVLRVIYSFEGMADHLIESETFEELCEKFGKFYKEENEVFDFKKHCIEIYLEYPDVITSDQLLKEMEDRDPIIRGDLGMGNRNRFNFKLSSCVEEMDDFEDYCGEIF